MLISQRTSGPRFAKLSDRFCSKVILVLKWRSSLHQSVLISCKFWLFFFLSVGDRFGFFQVVFKVPIVVSNFELYSVLRPAEVFCSECHLNKYHLPVTSTRIQLWMLIATFRLQYCYSSSPDEDQQYCSRSVAINIQSDSIVRQMNKVYLPSYITMNNKHRIQLLKTKK